MRLSEKAPARAVPKAVAAAIGAWLCSRRFGILAVGLGLVTALAAAGCGTVPSRPHPQISPTASSSPSASPPPTMAEQPTWLLTAQAIREMQGFAPVTTTLGSATVFELVGSSGNLYPGLQATKVVSFRSESGFSQWSPGAGGEPAAVLYDPEHWSFTPQAEQLNVALYASRFVALARSRSETPILAPGLDLVEALGSGGGPLADRYLSLGIPREMARALAGGSGVLEIQAQSQERSATAYRDLVAGAVAQVRASGSAVEILAGLSTNPSGGPVTEQELEADVRATDSLVSGYWLNVPDPGASCPSCGAANPGLGAALLQAIG